MKSKSQSDRLARLMAKGFGKAKASQALKDAGDNEVVALRILEEQRDQQRRAAGPRGAAVSEEAHSPSPAKTTSAIPSLHRPKPAPRSAHFATPSAATQASRRERQQLHPCLVQFGSCQFGEYCLLKDLPGDTCVQYFQGQCIYGSGCRRRHLIDGVDVREYVWGVEDSRKTEPLLRKGDAIYRLLPADGKGPKMLVAEAVNDALTDTPEVGGGPVHEKEGNYRYNSVPRGVSAPPFQASDFNRVRGSPPSHTDPILPSRSLLPLDALQAVEGERCSEDGDASDARQTEAGSHPTPYRDLCKIGTEDSASWQGVSLSTRVAYPADSTTITADAGLSRGALTLHNRRRHPCIAQYGSCKFGDACVYVDRDADVCLHFLHGRCRYSAEDCHYRHESEGEFHAALLARAGLADSSRSLDAWSDSKCEREDMSQAGKTKHRLQSTFVAETRLPACLRDVSSTCTPSRSTFPSAGVCAVHADASERTATTGENAVQHGDAGACHGCGAEMVVFRGLVEAFPSVERAVVLQALRLSGNDAIKASDYISRLGAALTFAESDDAAVALAVAEAEEADEPEASKAGASAQVQERHNALLTLLSLFPGAEPAAVESVLTQHHGDFAETYNVLFCTQENVARSAMWTGSTAAMTPLDQLRAEKLCAMFPELDANVVRDAYGAACCDWSRATEALNELTREMLALQSGVDVRSSPVGTAEAVVMWCPSRDVSASEAVAEGSSANDGAAGGVAEETSEEAYAAYRAAEEEILAFGDWRQVREQAYLTNAQRVRVLGQAAAAFLRGDGKTAKVLSRDGRRLAVEYNRLNRLAMLGLEQERLQSDAMSTLDLHGFHASEVHEVLVRRVRTCQHKGLRRLRIVVGKGLHSKRGSCSLYEATMHELREDAFLRSATKVSSVKAGYIDVTVR